MWFKKKKVFFFSLPVEPCESDFTDVSNTHLTTPEIYWEIYSAHTPALSLLPTSICSTPQSCASYLTISSISPPQHCALLSLASLYKIALITLSNPPSPQSPQSLQSELINISPITSTYIVYLIHKSDTWNIHTMSQTGPQLVASRSSRQRPRASNLYKFISWTIYLKFHGGFFLTKIKVHYCNCTN